MTVVQREVTVDSAYERRACPSCSSSESLPSIAAESPAERRTFDELAQHWYGFFKQKIFFSYHRCANCGILFAPAYFTLRQLEVLYASMPANMEQVSDVSLERTQRGYFEELRRVSPLTGQFLEIGPDVGMFARHCATDGNFTKFWMFEPNVDAHAKLQQNIGTIETHISTALLDLSEIASASINVAAMIHVLDHIVDPVTFLRELRPKLAHGAKLFIVTHDERSLMARATKGRWPAYCLQHPHLFNPASMERLLQRAGYRLERTIRSVNYFPVTFLIEQAALVGSLEIRLPRLSRFAIPLRLGNFMTVADVA